MHGEVSAGRQALEGLSLCCEWPSRQWLERPFMCPLGRWPRCFHELVRALGPHGAWYRQASGSCHLFVSESLFLGPSQRY